MYDIGGAYKCGGTSLTAFSWYDDGPMEKAAKKIYEQGKALYPDKTIFFYDRMWMAIISVQGHMMDALMLFKDLLRYELYERMQERKSTYNEKTN